MASGSKSIDLFPTGALYVVSGPAKSHKSHFAEYVARSYRQKGLRDALVYIDAPFSKKQTLEEIGVAARRTCTPDRGFRVLVIDDAHLLESPPGDYKTPLDAADARLRMLHQLAEELHVDLYAVCMQDKGGRVYERCGSLVTSFYELQTLASGEPGVFVFDPGSEDVDIYRLELREDGRIEGVAPYCPPLVGH